MDQHKQYSRLSRGVLSIHSLRGARHIIIIIIIILPLPFQTAGSGTNSCSIKMKK